MLEVVAVYCRLLHPEILTLVNLTCLTCSWFIGISACTFTKGVCDMSYFDCRCCWLHLRLIRQVVISLVVRQCVVSELVCDIKSVTIHRVIECLSVVFLKLLLPLLVTVFDQLFSEYLRQVVLVYVLAVLLSLLKHLLHLRHLFGITFLNRPARIQLFELHAFIVAVLVPPTLIVSHNSLLSVVRLDGSICMM